MSDPAAELRRALARTVLLIKRDIFPGLDDEQIADGLAAMTVRIVADARNLATPSAQTLVVASAICVAQSGAGVVLDLPDVALVAPQPPLAATGAGLVGALEAHLAELPSSAVTRPRATADVVVLVGDTPGPGGAVLHAGHVVRVTGDSWSTRLLAAPEPVSPWEGDQPFGAMLAACVIGAEAFRAAMRKLAVVHDVTPLTGVRLDRAERVELAVAPIGSRPVLGGRVDFVSAGAITNSAVFTLSRVPTLATAARIFDDDNVQISNLNRYPMLTTRELDAVKVEALAGQVPASWSVKAVPVRLGPSTIDGVAPLSRNTLIGVDDIPSRWLVQRHAPGWVCVAATSHFEVVVSEHEPGGPCAGCMHPHDDPDDELIPTVAFVSMLAGTLQAHRLVARLAGDAARPPMVAWALGLDREHGLLTLGQSPRADCPVRCDASKPLRAG
jgi:molybdopterin/thiamine biosynthesis adenylyltransferase